MSLYFKTLFILILFPILCFANSDINQIETLLQHKVNNKDWYNRYANELSNLNTGKVFDIEHYTKLILLDKGLELESEYRFLIVRSAVNAFNNIGEYNVANNFILSYLHQLGSIAESEKYADIWFDLALNYDLISKKDSLNYVIETTKRFVNKNTSSYYKWLLVEARGLTNEGKYSGAIKACFEAAQYFEKVNDLTTLAVAYNLLGINYDAIHNYTDALGFYIQAKDINKQLNNKKELSKNYNNIGAMYNALKNYDKASEFYMLAYEIIAQLGDIQLLAQNLTNRGNVFERKGDYKNSLALFQKCKELCKEHNIYFGIMLSELNAGNSYMLMKNYSNAESSFKKGLDLAIQLKSKNIEAIAYRHFAELYFSMKDWKKAYQMVKIFHSMDDSIRNEKLTNQTLELKEKYESEKKSNTITRLSKQKLTQQLIIILLISGILLLIVLLQWYRIRQKQAKTDAILLVHEQNILKKVLETKEKELTKEITQIMQLERYFQETHDKLLTVIDSTTDDPSEMKKKIRQIIKSKTFSNLSDSFNERIAEVNGDLFKRLLELYPELTPNELKVCAYLRLNISTKEIAQLLKKSIRTIETTRTDIRKKMQLSADVNLVSHLLKFGY